MTPSSCAPVGPGECIDDDALAAYIEGRVTEQARSAIDDHLAQCEECRRIVGCALATTPRSAGATLDEDPPVSRRSADVRTDDLSPGTRVGRYVIQRVVGRGAMGVVYAANDPDLNRTVAVKLLNADALLYDEQHRLRTRLLREAQAMARLSHPEVITVYDVGALGQQLFVAMEYVDGETLRQWCAAHRRTVSEVLVAYERAGSGLAAAHEAGLVHRDFKPDNVLVGKDGRVRVTDFGLARAAQHPELAAIAPEASDARTRSVPLSVTLTRTGSLMGTPAYMAPEQLCGKTADARSDVFSYCVALYEALYGERPFEGSNVTSLRASIERGRVPLAPRTTRVPRWVRGVLLRGLRAAPEQRFASMRPLLVSLGAARERSRRRTLRSAVGVVAGALALAGAAHEAYWATRETPREHSVAAPAVPTLVPSPISHVEPAADRPTPSVASRPAVPQLAPRWPRAGLQPERPVPAPAPAIPGLASGSRARLSTSRAAAPALASATLDRGSNGALILGITSSVAGTTVDASPTITIDRGSNGAPILE